MASGPIASWQIDGETVEIVRDFFGAPKSLLMVIAAMKLKEAYSPGKSHGRRSLVGYSLWGRKESDMTEGLN